MRKLLVFLGLTIIVAVAVMAVVRKERLIESGRRVVLELGPRDPRSLMQGDYMRLTYDAASALREIDELPHEGAVVMKDDADGVGRMVRVDDGSTLAEGEYRIRYRRDHRSYRLGPDAFFFEEGRAGEFSGAEYGEFRVADDGSVVLVRLLDAEGNPLGG